MGWNSNRNALTQQDYTQQDYALTLHVASDSLAAKETVYLAKRKIPAFGLLWDAYPGVQMPCDGPWDNQCAIRMSLALEGAGFALTNYTEPKCAHGHARGAESLANYLWKQAGRPKISTTADAGRKAVAGKKGLVFFKDISGFRGGIGDHFDLWNAGSTKTGEYFDLSKQTWFWETT